MEAVSAYLQALEPVVEDLDLTHEMTEEELNEFYTALDPSPAIFRQELSA